MTGLAYNWYRLPVNQHVSDVASKPKLLRLRRFSEHWFQQAWRSQVFDSQLLLDLMNWKVSATPNWFWRWLWDMNLQRETPGMDLSTWEVYDIQKLNQRGIAPPHVESLILTAMEALEKRLCWHVGNFFGPEPTHGLRAQRKWSFSQDLFSTYQGRCQKVWFQLTDRIWKVSNAIKSLHIQGHRKCMWLWLASGHWIWSVLQHFFSEWRFLGATLVLQLTLHSMLTVEYQNPADSRLHLGAHGC